MVYQEKKYLQVFMNRLILHIVGMLLIEYQIIYYLNYKDTQIIMRMHINLIKHYVLLKRVLNCLMDILFAS